MDELADIFIIEDDSTIRMVLEMALLADGFKHVASAARGDDGLEELKRRHPDLVLLDVMLPGLDGFTICRRIHEIPELSSMRVIMITARTATADIVRGLECGADDYVTKPFDRQVLLARVRAVLRRGVLTMPTAAFDGLELDESAHAVKLNGEPLKLAPGEFRILSLLVAHRGRVLARTRIIDLVSSDVAREVTERTVDVQIATLRRKLGAWANHIETIRGIGYRIT